MKYLTQVYLLELIFNIRLWFLCCILLLPAHMPDLLPTKNWRIIYLFEKVIFSFWSSLATSIFHYTFTMSFFGQFLGSWRKISLIIIYACIFCNWSWQYTSICLIKILVETSLSILFFYTTKNLDIMLYLELLIRKWYWSDGFFKYLGIYICCLISIRNSIHFED